MNHRVRFFDDNGICIVTVIGQFDTSNANVLEATIEAALKGEKPVVVDLSPASYIDSTVLAVFARHKKRVGARLRIVAPRDGNIRKVFDVTGLQTALSVNDSIAAASTDCSGLARTRTK